MTPIGTWISYQRGTRELWSGNVEGGKEKRCKGRKRGQGTRRGLKAGTGDSPMADAVDGIVLAAPLGVWANGGRNPWKGWNA